jgi:hypothetical protein
VTDPNGTPCPVCDQAAVVDEEGACVHCGADRNNLIPTHSCSVVERSTLGEGLDSRRYYVSCAFCGWVGAPQVYEVDARAIADRHQGIGGFER